MPTIDYPPGIIAVDFDGTVVTHEFPRVGQDVPGAAFVLNRLVLKGHKLVLWTMRSGDYLQDAVDWFANHDIPLYGIQRNPEQDWTTSPKCYANIYIDDAALGCPLIYPLAAGARPYVNWGEVARILKANDD